MTKDEVVKKLKSLGTEQCRKIYARHGASDKQCGVKFADLYKIQKEIKQDHELAKELWKTGIDEAMILATLVADPEKFSKAEAEKWVKDVEYFMVSGYLSGLVAKMKELDEIFEEWSKSDKEYHKACAYSAISSYLRDGGKLSAAKAKKILASIEKEIHDSPNRARYSMNNTLIAIGTYIDELHKEALATAKRIGPVEVIHGTKGCKTPDAHSYILKSYERRKKKEKK